jgi:serine/threonine protein kinase
MTCQLNESKPCDLGSGSPGYRAPELIRENGSFSPSVDVWALGCILYEIAKKKTAFKDDHSVRYYADSNLRLDAVVTLDKDEDKDFCRLLKETLSISAERRPSSASLHQQIAAKLWRSTGDDLQNQKLYKDAIVAYEKGITATGVASDPVHGPLFRGLFKAKEAESDVKVSRRLSIVADHSCQSRSTI